MTQLRGRVRGRVTLRVRARVRVKVRQNKLICDWIVAFLTFFSLRLLGNDAELEFDTLGHSACSR